RVVLDQAAYRVPAGHHLRVAISTAYWPMIWPSPEPTCLRLFGSTMKVPVRRTAVRSEAIFPPPEAAAPWRTETLRPTSSERIVEHDQKTGTVTLKINDDFGEVRDLDHGLVSGHMAEERWTIHPDDPLSARAETHWTQTLSRGDWSVRTETWSTMHSDR